MILYIKIYPLNEERRDCGDLRRSRGDMMSSTKKRRGFTVWIIYGAFVVLLCVCAVLALVYTHNIVLEYDAAQPENVTDEFLSDLKGIKNDTYELPEYTVHYLVGNEKYNVGADRSSLSYLKSSISDDTSVRLAESSSDNDVLYRKYTVTSGGKGIGTLTLRGENQRTKLFFFSMADWKIEKFEPVVSAEYYSVKIYLPDGIKATVNGVAVSDDEIRRDEDVPYCQIDELLSEPTVKLTDDNGDVDFILRGGTAYPARYCYTLTLPDYIKVYKNGALVEHDQVVDGKYQYTFAEMTEPSVEIEDETGYKKTVVLSDPDVSIYEYYVTIPDSYTLSVGDYEPKPTGKVTPHRDADSMSEYYEVCGIRLPDGVEYHFASLDPDAEYVIHTEKGDVKMKGRSTVVSDLFSSDTLPDLAADIDVYKICMVWSDFMTCDLEGKENGFYNVAKYLVKDSSLYKYAYSWATGVDITFGWDHKILGVEETAITDYIKYSDTCFSCHVHFRKRMFVYFNSIYRDDVFDNLVYFIYIDDTDDNTDNPHWVIASLHGWEAE